ncbi:MAG: deacylase, partial [Gammaproteobacteria bacterium]|nr:deacylase [Gammaproteobacteria bacterium]
NIDVDKARKYINYFPLKKHSVLQYSKNNPLLAVVDSNNSFKVRYGNRHITSLRAQYFDYDYTLDSFNIQADGQNRVVKIGEKINIENNFKVLAADNYRVNIIGFSRKGIKNENKILIEKKQIIPRFSVDRDEKVYRVEFYNGERFSGMILVNFIERKSPPLTMKKNSYANSSL